VSAGGNFNDLGDKDRGIRGNKHNDLTSSPAIYSFRPPGRTG